MRRTCPTCEVSWPSSAVWCGHCGQPLTETRDLSSISDAPTVDDSRFRNLTIIVLVVAMVVLLGAAAIRGPLATSLGGRDDAIALPTPDADDTGQDRQVDELRCEPAGCELWRVDLEPGGATHVLRDAIYHVGLREVVVIDHDDGTIRWRTSLGQTRGRHDAQIIEVGDDWLVVATTGVAQLWDRHTGEPRLRLDWTSEGGVWHATVEGDVLILAGTGYDAALQQDDPTDVSGYVLRAYDIATGDLRWERWAEEHASGDALLIREDGHLHALDPQTGEARWSRLAQQAWGQDWQATPQGQVALADMDGALEVLDAESGEVVARLPDALADVDLEKNPYAAQVQIFGDLVSVLIDDGRMQDAWPATFYDLDSGEIVRHHDAAFWPWQVRDLVILPWPAGDRIRVTAFDIVSGQMRWESEIEDAQSCCPWGRPGTHDTLILELWEPDATARIVVSAATGEILEEFRAPHGPEGHGSEVGVEHEGDSTRLSGPNGFAVFSQRVELAFSPSPLLVQSRQGEQLIRVNDEMLFGKWRPLWRE